MSCRVIGWLAALHNYLEKPNKIVFRGCLQGRPSHGGNEAEIFIIAILGELAILGGVIVSSF